MFGAKAVEDLIDVAHVLHPDFALFGGGDLGPAGFAEGAVHIPLEIADIVLGGELIEEAEDIFLDVVAGDIEDHLRAQFAARAAGEIDHPIGMGAVQIAIGVDHFGLNPESEIHFEVVDAINQGLQPLGKLLRVDGPIAEAGVVVVALAEPAIVDHEEFDTELGGLGGEIHLALFVDGESGGLPGIVEHGAQAGGDAAGENLFACKAVQRARSGAEAVGGEAAVEGRRVQRFAGFEGIGEIEAVEAAGDAYLAIGRLLDGDAPVAAPSQGAEPHRAVLFGGVTGIDGKPRICIVAGMPLTAFEDLLAFVNGLVIHLGFGGPASGEVRELVAFAGRQVPGGGLRAL